MTEIIYREQNEQELYESEVWEAERPVRERAIIQDIRRQAYQREADPLYFGFQRGDNTEQEWLDAVQAVKDANPYPSVES